jgi:hypothetical protein
VATAIVLEPWNPPSALIEIAPGTVKDVTVVFPPSVPLLPKPTPPIPPVPTMIEITSPDVTL